MPQFILSKSSLDKLTGVHPDLVKVVELAIQITPLDFAVTAGLRDAKTEAEYVKKGTSKTHNSRHLTGHAVDLTPYANKRPVDGNKRENWPYFEGLANTMKSAAQTLKIPIEWGGDWKSPVDGYHFQLPWKDYPLR